MPAPSRLEKVLIKYRRANERILEFNAAVESLRKNNADIVGRRRNPQTGDVTLYVTKTWEIGPEIPAMIGDVFQNLRTALDHLVWQMVEAAGNKPTRDTAFPIFETAAKYKSGVKPKLKGLRRQAIDLIDRCEPYKRENGIGNADLWLLHNLNIVDKHRLLFTVGLADVARSMTPRESVERFRNYGPIRTLMTSLAQDGIIVEPKSPSRLLEEGTDLLTLRGAEANEDVKFFFEIAIDEPEYMRGAPIAWLLIESIAAEVRRVIYACAPFL